MSTLKVNTINVESGNVVTVGADCHVTGNLVVTGALHARTTDFVVSSNSTTLGDAAGDTITINASTVSTPNKLAFAGTNPQSNALMLTGSLNVSGSGINLTALGNAASAVLTMNADNAEDAADTMTLTVANSGGTTLATAGGDITLDPGSAGVVIDGGLRPNADSTRALGHGSYHWHTLYVDNIYMDGQGRIDLDGDGDTSIRATTDDVMLFEIAGTDKLRADVDGLQITGSLQVSGSGITLTGLGNESSAVLTMKADNAEDAADVMTLSVADGGDTTLDVAGDIELNADGGQVTIKDGSASHFLFDCDSTSLKIYDDADADDYFQVSVTNNGATIFQTRDNDGTSANMEMNIEGDLTIDVAGGNVTIFDDSQGHFAFNCDDTYISISDDQDTGDEFKIQVAQHGATTLSTVDDDATAGDIMIAPDGHLKLQPPFTHSCQVTGSLEVTGSGIILTALGNAASAVLTMKADNGEDAADTMTLTVADSGETTLKNNGTGDIILDTAGADVLFKHSGNSRGGIFCGASNGITFIDSLQYKRMRVEGHPGADATWKGSVQVTGSLEVTGSGIILKSVGNASSAVLTMSADNGEDAADTTTLTVADGGATTLANGGNDITVDAVGDIILDADGDHINFKFGGATGQLDVTNANSGDIIIQQKTSAKDIVFQDSDGVENMRIADDAAGVTILGKNDGAATLYLKADNSDDAGDDWTISSNPAQTLTFSNDIASAGTAVAQLTVTPNAATGSSVTSVGKLKLLGNQIQAATGLKALEVNSVGNLVVTNNLILEGHEIYDENGDKVLDFNSTGELSVEWDLEVKGGDITLNNASSNSIKASSAGSSAAGRDVTITAGPTSAGGTSNLAGGALKLQGGKGKGTGKGGSIVFETALAGSSGTSLNSHVQAMEISEGDIMMTGSLNISGSGIVLTGAEAAAATITLKADQSDDAGDDWTVVANADQTFTIGNDIASAGTSVAHLTITPHATVASSVVAVAGDLKLGGNTIQASDGGDTITLDTDDNVTILGDLMVSGGDILGPTDGDLYIKSDGNMTFRIDGDNDETGQSFAFQNNTSTEIANLSEGGDLQIDGDLTVSGGDISYANTANATLSVAATAHNAAGKLLTLTAGPTTAGTTNNIAGGALVLQGGQGKGSGAGGDIILQTSQPGGSGHSLNSSVHHLVLSGSSARSTFDSQLDYRRNVEFVTGDKTLTNHDSGKLILINGDTITITLPDSGLAQNTGCFFTFFHYAGTSNANMHKIVVADTSNEKIYGSMKQYDMDTANTFTVVTGSTSGGSAFNVRSVVLNGTTDGANGSIWSICAATTDTWIITQSEIIHTGTANGTNAQHIFREA